MKKLLLFPLFGLSIIYCGTPKKEPEAVPTVIRPVPEAMVLIPGGYFIMGSDSGDQQPKHKVWVDTFYMDKYEVTNREYLEFIKATGHPKPPFINDSSLNKPNHPVVGVSYFDCLAYAHWAGKDLPSEAEWEYAARGGLAEKDFPWGNESPFKRCNYAPEGERERDGYLFTSPVGKYPANKYGLYDMAGNVWEWCKDFYDSTYYQRSPERNPTGPDSGYTRVVRGGSWLSINPKYLQCSYRLELKPFVRDRYYGFRCVKRR